MSDRPNLFAEAENVGQLFDALWFNATEAADKLTKDTMMGDGENDPQATFRRAREMAIADAFARYDELQKT